MSCELRFVDNYIRAKLLASYWPGAMQLIRNCMSEMRAKLVIVI